MSLQWLGSAKIYPKFQFIIIQNQVSNCPLSHNCLQR